jgi:hypothetical protein
MPVDTPVIVAVAGEDRAHFDVVSKLMDRMVHEQRPWTVGNLEVLRTWLACGDRPWFSFKDAVRRAKAEKLRFHGKFGDAAGLPDAQMARAQLAMWKNHVDRGHKLDAVVLARDLDGRPTRRDGLLQAVTNEPWPFAVLVAWCQPEAEAWYICAFAACDDAEHKRLAEIERTLELSPIHAAERLTSTAPDPRRDAKRVLAQLTADDHERRERCLAAPLDHLRTRGPHTGLTAFLSEVEAKYLPLWG